MKITDEMVETAARAVFEHWQFQQSSTNGPVKWVAGGNSLKQGEARSYARAAIEAAAPKIRAAALEEAAKVAKAVDEENCYYWPDGEEIADAILALKDTVAHEG